MEKNSEQLARNPINRNKNKRPDEIKDMEENESPSKIYPDLNLSDESDDNTNNHRQEKTLSKLGNEKKRETPPTGKVKTQLKSSNVKQIETLPEGSVIQSSPSETNICLYRIGFLAMSIIIALIAAKFYFGSDVSEPLTANKVVETLKQQFSGQSDLTFKIIKTSINKIISGTDLEPTQPSIILLMSSKGANETGSLFAKELAQLISSNYLTIYGHGYKDTNKDETKKSIDHKIRSECEEHKPAVVLLQDLDMLPAFSAKILLSYCDHENAPYKKAVFIMTISIGKVIPTSADSKVFDRLANTHLKQSWHRMSDDDLSPLLSRITVSVAGIFADNPSK